MTQAVFALREAELSAHLPESKAEWDASTPYKHAMVDNFLSAHNAEILSEHFPKPDHPVWLDWKKRSPYQYGKQGPGNSDRFELLDWQFSHALQQFNSSIFIRYLERLTLIEGLIPDPYFTGGGMHQILQGGILDIHTDFNYYERLNLYRRLNVLLYLTTEWQEDYGGALELWDESPKHGGKCIKSVAPLFNRMFVFETDKTSFHGHPKEWNAPNGICRRSIALFFYTADKLEHKKYDAISEFQNYVSKPLPISE